MPDDSSARNTGAVTESHAGAPLIVVGIDSATSTGWAVIHRDERGRETRLGSGVTSAESAGGIAAFVQTMTTTWPTIDLVAVEDAYLDKNPKTLKVLCRIQGRWLQEFERAGIRCTLVDASTWQIGMLRGLIQRASPRKDRKKAAILWARRLLGAAVTSDEADALCLATWAARTEVIKPAASRDRPLTDDLRVGEVYIDRTEAQTIVMARLDVKSRPG